jgi:hypothetical protein
MHLVCKRFQLILGMCPVHDYLLQKFYDHKVIYNLEWIIPHTFRSQFLDHLDHVICIFVLQVCSIFIHFPLTMAFPFLKKWMPVAKENWVILKKNAEPYVRMASTKSVEVYQASKDFITPHLVNACEVADPYLQVHVLLFSRIRTLVCYFKRRDVIRSFL